MAWNPPKHFCRNGKAYGLARRVKQIQIMRLPILVVRSQFQHIILELRGNLRSGIPKRPSHRRIHRRLMDIRAVEFINHPCLSIKDGIIEFLQKLIDFRQIIRRQRPFVQQTGRIPAMGDALYIRLGDRFLRILPDAEENRFRSAGFPQSIHQRIHKRRNILFRKIFFIKRFIDQFEDRNGGIIRISLSVVAIDMLSKLFKKVCHVAP